MQASEYGLSANDLVKFANNFEKSIAVGGKKNVLAEKAPKKRLLKCILFLSTENS